MKQPESVKVGENRRYSSRGNYWRAFWPLGTWNCGSMCLKSSLPEFY